MKAFFVYQLFLCLTFFSAKSMEKEFSKFLELSNSLYLAHPITTEKKFKILKKIITLEQTYSKLKNELMLEEKDYQELKDATLFSEKCIKLLPSAEKLKECFMFVNGTETKLDVDQLNDDIAEKDLTRAIDMVWGNHRKKFGPKIDEYLKGPQIVLKDGVKLKDSFKFKFLKNTYNYKVTFYKHDDSVDLLIGVEQVF